MPLRLCLHTAVLIFTLFLPPITWARDKINPFVFLRVVDIVLPLRITLEIHPVSRSPM